MAKKQYAYRTRYLAATPRNKRLTEGIQQAASSGGSGGGTTVVPSAPSIDIIASDSQVLPTDDNVFSAARTLVEINNAFTGASAIFDQRYLRKDVDDLASGNIRFAKQISSEAFASGLTGTGWRITQEGDGEMRSLFLREWLETPELRYNRVTVTGDEFWVATGIKADQVSGNTITAKLEEGEVIAVQAGDILRGVYHHANGFSTSFIKVLSVDTSAGTFTFEKIRGADPVRFMTFARQGNDTNEERQRSIYLSGLDGYQRFLGGVNSADITFDNIYAQFGNLDGLVTPYFGTLSGEGIYIRKGYIEGAIHVTGGNAATQEFVSTEIGKGIADLTVGVDNLLLNTGFAGDYLPAELEEMTLFNRQKILYSDPLKYWTVAGAATVGIDESSRSGYACVLSGTMSQSPVIPIEVGGKYVASLKAKGTGTLTISTGGVSETFTLTSVYQRLVLKVEATGTAGFSLTASSSATVCEIKLERGTVATDWEPAFLDNNRMEGRLQAMKYVFDAIQNETDIYGGLVLTNILMVGNYTNGKMSEVTAGMSGVYNDGSDVAFWAGGTLEQAIRAVSNPSLTSGVANAVITHGGLAILNNAYVRGTVYANDGIFRGTVYASGGEFNGIFRTGLDGFRVEIKTDSYYNFNIYDELNRAAIRMGVENGVGFSEIRLNGYSGSSTSPNTVTRLSPAGFTYTVGSVSFGIGVNAADNHLRITASLPDKDTATSGEWYVEDGNIKVK